MSTFKPEFLSRCKDFAESEGLLAPGMHVVLAVSGGVDSMTMLHAFVELREEWKLTLSVAHVNHQLRGEESDGDEAFVKKAAEALAIPFYSTRVATLDTAQKQGIGKQEVARELRYQYFEQVRQQVRAGAVATAHNADDNAETVLMNALRGSGIHGLAGIPLHRGQGSVIRPMLFAYRNEIAQYASESGIAFREDSSNASQEYTRNLIRLNVMPYLTASLETNVAHSLNRISAVMREMRERLSAESGSVYAEVVSVDHSRTIVNIPLFLKQKPLVQDEILLSVFRSLHIEPQAEKLFAVLNLCTGQTGRSLSLSATVSTSRDRDQLVFGAPAEPKSFEFAVDLGRHYPVGEFDFCAERVATLPTTFTRSGSEEFVDSTRLGTQLVLRNWKAGDWFIPLGLHNKKKLSDFFIDEKVSRHEKQSIPVLESDGEIVWVCGYRLDERFMVTPQTASVVKLQYVSRSHVSI